MSENIKKEEVNHPQRYSGHCSLECIDVMEIMFGTEYTCAFCLENAFKYMWRYKDKNGKEDIDKTYWYIHWVEHQLSLGYELPQRLKVLYDGLYDQLITINDKFSNGIE